MRKLIAIIFCLNLIIILGLISGPKKALAATGCALGGYNTTNVWGTSWDDCGGSCAGPGCENRGIRAYELSPGTRVTDYGFQSWNWNVAIPSWAKDGLTHRIRMLSYMGNGWYCTQVPGDVVCGEFNYTYNTGAPNCSSVSGPTRTTVGQSATYQATYSNYLGPVTNIGLYSNQAGVCFTGGLNATQGAGPGTYSFNWTPSATGSYSICCRAWNDGIAECRGNCVDTPPRYLCAGPGSCLSVAVVLPPPASVSASCPAPGSSATVSWSAVSGATAYGLRVNDTTANPAGLNYSYATGTCQGLNGDVCIDNLTTTTYTFTSVPGHVYHWWVHAINAAGWSNATFGDFTCTLPASPTGLNAKCTAPGTLGVLSWNWISGATYALRVDDTSNGWSGTCAWTYPGDVCIDNLSSTLYNMSTTPGHTYNWWVHSIIGGVFSSPTYGSLFTCTTCTSHSLQSSSATPATVDPGGNVTVSCDYGQQNLDCINANNGGGSSCSFSNWNGSSAVFNCTARMIPGTYTAVCGNSSGTAAYCCARSDNDGTYVVSTPTPVPTPAPSFPGVVSAGGGFSGNISTKMSTRMWQVNNDSFDGFGPNHTKYDYTYFYAKLGIAPGVTPAFTGSKPGLNGTYFANGDVSIGNQWNLSQGEKYIIVVNGKLTINAPISVNEKGGFLAFIASGNIEVDKNIGYNPQANFRSAKVIDGIYITDGSFRTLLSSQAVDDTHKIMIGKGTFISKANFDFVRDLGATGTYINANTPAEYFEFRPDLLANFPKEISIRQITWKEVAP